MGTPIPRPHPPDHGEPCVFCENLVWGDARTPKTVRVVFHDIIAAPGMPDPPNGLPLLLQQGVDPFCGWWGVIGDGTNDWRVLYFAHTSSVQLDLFTGGTFLYFYGLGPPCMGGPHPRHIYPPEVYAFGGKAYVLDLPLEYVYKVADVYGIAPDPLGLYDSQPTGIPDEQCLRLASRTFGGSVLVKINTLYPGGFLMPGIIALWSGSIVTIPTGWQLCDGTNGTPDLRDRFVVGAGPVKAPGEIGGAAAHLHTVNLGTHSHDLPDGYAVAPGETFSHNTSSALVSGNTANASSLPPYYALCYIMYL